MERRSEAISSRLVGPSQVIALEMSGIVFGANPMRVPVPLLEYTQDAIHLLLLAHLDAEELCHESRCSL